MLVGTCVRILASVQEAASVRARAPQPRPPARPWRAPDRSDAPLPRGLSHDPPAPPPPPRAQGLSVEEAPFAGEGAGGYQRAYRVRLQFYPAHKYPKVRRRPLPARGARRMGDCRVQGSHAVP